MSKNYDKPKYIDTKRSDSGDNEKKKQKIELIKEMMEEELFGVLATMDDTECYTSLISFACDDNFKTLVFATPIKTKKYTMIEKNVNVSILVDNRSSNKKSLNDIAAITSLGRARIIKDAKEIEKWSKLLRNKHNYLDEFISAETTAVVLVDISKYLYVSSFQETIEWSPSI